MSDIPNFSNSVDADKSIIPDITPDFSNSQEFPDDHKPVENKQSLFLKVARMMTKQSVIERFKTSLYLQDKMPEVIPGESINEYDKRVNESLQSREDEIISGGVASVFETPIDGLIAASFSSAPLMTTAGIAGYTGLDKLYNFRSYTKEKFPEVNQDLLAAIEITDMVSKAAILGVAGVAGKNIMNRLESLGMARNTNIKSENIKSIKESQNLTDLDKADISKTLGISDKHVDASINSNVPINVRTEDIIALSEKPYWELLKNEISPKYNIAEGTKPAILEPSINQELIVKLKSLQKEKGISSLYISKLKKFLDIGNIKKEETNKLKALTDFVEQLKPEDKFLTDKQINDLNSIIGDIPNVEVVPKRVLLEKFGQKESIFTEGLTGKVINELLPTVDIKTQNPLIKNIVDKAGEALSFAEKEVGRRDEKLDLMLKKAEKSREPLLTAQERISRKLFPQNKEIFSALSGEKINLTKEETAVVAYLKNFFNMAKNDLKLDKYRKNYVTHIEKDFAEKVLDYGLVQAFKEYMGGQKKGDIPTDILLELENIIGSEKFFKYALERKGGVDPTTNIRRIIHEYSNMYETKKALDSILPEGQAITNNLLSGKDAVWMKTFLQNLKGRGMDNKFRTGKMGWLSKVADGVVDIGYQKLLGLNWKSALKNVVAGESNSWVYQDFPSYLKGKQRWIENPRKAYQMATEYGILEGTFADYSQKGIGKLKKMQDFSMIGQRAGEIEVRSSILTSMLTDKEWKTGKISPQKIQDIKDTVAITQGIFSKVDSPLVLQTWWGRMFFQMNRWRITNAMLLRRISVAAAKDVKNGNYKTQNINRFGKMMVAYGMGMYISYELNKAGYKTASDVAKNSAQILDGSLSLFTQGDLIRMFRDNPTLQTFGEISSTIQNLLYYIKVPGSKKSKETGIEDTYIAPVENINDIIDAIE